MSPAEQITKNPLGLIFAVLLGALIVYILYRIFRREADSDDEDDTRYASHARRPTGEYPQLIFFHGVWCPHCKHMMPEWNSAKSRIQARGIKCIEIESADPRIENYEGIEGFPTVRYYKAEGVYTEFPSTSERNADALVSFASKAQAESMDEPCVGCDEGSSSQDEGIVGHEGIRKRRSQYLNMSE